MSQMGINMIQMYEGMIKQEFEPLVEILKMRTGMIRENVMEMVKKEVGLYDLKAKRAAMKEKLDEIDLQIKEWEAPQYDWQVKHRISKLQKMVDERLLTINRPLARLLDEKTAMVKSIRLCSAQQEVQLLFKAIEKTLADFKEEVDLLPELTEGDIKKLGSARMATKPKKGK